MAALPSPAFQSAAFQNDAFQIYDETTIDDGLASGRSAFLGSTKGGAALKGRSGGDKA